MIGIRGGLACTGVIFLVSSVASCATIEPKPLSDAAVNSCAAFPCENYEKGSRTGAVCQKGRCEIRGASGRPDYPFWIVVHVPDTSFFAPGMTFVMFSDLRGEPAFGSRPDASPRCRPPNCLTLAPLSRVRGQYLVTTAASIAVGYPFPLAEDTSIPVRVVLEPVGNSQLETFDETLPLDTLFSSSAMVLADGQKTKRPEYGRVVPAAKYLRVFYPEPPFDAYFPPTTDTQIIEGTTFFDNVRLGDDSSIGKPLDHVKGTSRDATVTRDDGLDGWRLWLEDQSSHRRISVIRTLSGKQSTVQLFTSGEDNRGAGGAVGLGSEVDAVLSPPEDWTAVPRFVSPLFNGQGLSNLRYPTIPPPVVVTGVVALPGEGATLLGVKAKIFFESDRLTTRASSEQLLKYSTSLSTDDKGRFATILPPGSYAVTIEPAGGTGLATTRQLVTVDRDVTALTLRPPARTVVRGRAVLTDGRPLNDADVIAIPENPQNPQTPKPRPGRTQTLGDGRFELELDPGPYVFTIIPKAGTGFPRVTARPEIPARATELPDIRVPAPTPLKFQLRDPSLLANPIAQAVVRILAPGQGRPPIEVGSAMTDTEGNVEILLAQEPR